MALYGDQGRAVQSPGLQPQRSLPHRTAALLCRGLSIEEIDSRVDALKRQLFALRIKHAKLDEVGQGQTGDEAARGPRAPAGRASAPHAPVTARPRPPRPAPASPFHRHGSRAMQGSSSTRWLNC